MYLDEREFLYSNKSMALLFMLHKVVTDSLLQLFL